MLFCKLLFPSNFHKNYTEVVAHSFTACFNLCVNYQSRLCYHTQRLLPNCCIFLSVLFDHEHTLQTSSFRVMGASMTLQPVLLPQRRSRCLPHLLRKPGTVSSEFKSPLSISPLSLTPHKFTSRFHYFSPFLVAIPLSGVAHCPRNKIHAPCPCSSHPKSRILPASPPSAHWGFLSAQHRGIVCLATHRTAVGQSLSYTSRTDTPLHCQKPQCQSPRV